MSFLKLKVSYYFNLGPSINRMICKKHPVLILFESTNQIGRKNYYIINI